MAESESRTIDLADGGIMTANPTTSRVRVDALREGVDREFLEAHYNLVDVKILRDRAELARLDFYVQDEGGDVAKSEKYLAGEAPSYQNSLESEWSGDSGMAHFHRGACSSLRNISRFLKEDVVRLKDRMDVLLTKMESDKVWRESKDQRNYRRDEFLKAFLEFGFEDARTLSLIEIDGKIVRGLGAYVAILDNPLIDPNSDRYSSAVKEAISFVERRRDGFKGLEAQKEFVDYLKNLGEDRKRVWNSRSRF